MPRPTKQQTTDYGLRPDGTRKGPGWLGKQRLPNGGVATEYSVALDDVKDKRGRTVDFPTLVPTLPKEQTKRMREDVIPRNKRVPNDVMGKAVGFARGRLSKNLSPFLDEKPVGGRGGGGAIGRGAPGPAPRATTKKR